MKMSYFRILPFQMFSRRCFHTTQIRRLGSESVKEVKIPIPWGHIAGKWWGNKTVEPIIAVHGWLDNAGLWDPLAELLPDDLSVLAIDLPGHGRSSHLPLMQNYYVFDAIAAIRWVKYYFMLDKINFLSHSIGALACFSYAATFPEDVISFLCVDPAILTYTNEKRRAASIGKVIDKKIEQNLKRQTPPGYSWEEVKQMWIKGTSQSLNGKSAEVLMRRGVDKMENGKFKFSRDHRMKPANFDELNPEQLLKIADGIKCHVRIISATVSPFSEKVMRQCPDFFDTVQKNAESFERYTIDGKHHLHMDVPEKILPVLKELVNINNKI